MAIPLRTLQEHVDIINSTGTYYEIVRVYDLNKGVKLSDKFIFICTKCNRAFYKHLRFFQNKKMCRKCVRESLRTPYSEVVKTIEGSGLLQVLSKEDEYTKGVETEIKVKCKFCGHTKIITAKMAMKWQGCDNCRFKRFKTHMRPLKSYTKVAKEKFNKTFISYNGEYIGGETIATWKCDICGDINKVSFQEAVKDRYCPVCAKDASIKVNTKTEEDSIKILNSGYKSVFVNWIDGYKNSRSKCYMHCNVCNGNFISSANQFIMANRCPLCSSKKFKYLYITEFFGRDVGRFIKFGITNVLGDRLYRQAHESGTLPKLIRTFYFEKYNAREIELLIKNTFDCGVVTKEQFPDGFTETLNFSDLPRLIEFINSKLENK